MAIGSLYRSLVALTKVVAEREEEQRLSKFRWHNKEQEPWVLHRGRLHKGALYCAILMTRKCCAGLPWR